MTIKTRPHNVLGLLFSVFLWRHIFPPASFIEVAWHWWGQRQIFASTSLLFQHCRAQQFSVVGAVVVVFYQRFTFSYLDPIQFIHCTAVCEMSNRAFGRLCYDMIELRMICAGLVGNRIQTNIYWEHFRSCFTYAARCRRCQTDHTSGRPTCNIEPKR